jgi:hypothetical protein
VSGVHLRNVLLGAASALALAAVPTAAHAAGSCSWKATGNLPDVDHLKASGTTCAFAEGVAEQVAIKVADDHRFAPKVTTVQKGSVRLFHWSCRYVAHGDTHDFTCKRLGDTVTGRLDA